MSLDPPAIDAVLIRHWLRQMYLYDVAAIGAGGSREPLVGLLVVSRRIAEGPGAEVVDVSGHDDSLPLVADDFSAQRPA